jgi:hypothetical protein
MDSRTITRRISYNVSCSRRVRPHDSEVGTRLAPFIITSCCKACDKEHVPQAGALAELEHFVIWSSASLSSEVAMDGNHFLIQPQIDRVSFITKH